MEQEWNGEDGRGKEEEKQRKYENMNINAETGRNAKKNEAK